MALSKSNDNINSMLKLFYNIRIKDYFSMLSTYVDKKYNDEYEVISSYSDADINYLIRHKEKGKEVKINPDVTIGEMLYISCKLKCSDEYDKLEKLPYPPSTMATMSYRIAKSIMVEPFYDLFETHNGKKAFNTITYPKPKKRRNENDT